MKTNICINVLAVLMLLQVTDSFAQVKWLTMQQALELHKKQPKKIFIDLYTDWCGWCKRMDAATFAHPVIADKLNKDFYPVKFNAESKEPIVFQGTKFVNEYRTHQFAIAITQGNLSFPTTVYFDEKLQLITYLPGYRNAMQMEQILDFFIKNAYINTSFDDYVKTHKGTITQ